MRLALVFLQIVLLITLLAFPANAQKFVCTQGKTFVLFEKKKITAGLYKKLLQRQLKKIRTRKIAPLTKKIKALDSFTKRCKNKYPTNTPTSLPSVTPTPSNTVLPESDLCIKPEMFGAFADGLNHLATASELSQKGIETSYGPGTSWDFIGIQEAIKNSPSNKKVCLGKDKEYLLRTPNEVAIIKINSGTKIEGNNATLRSISADNQPTQKILIQAQSGVVPSNVSLSSFTLVKGRIALGGVSESRWAENIEIEKMNFIDGWTLLGSSNDSCNALLTSTCPKVLEITRTKDAIVRNNTFTRDINTPGSGVSLWRTKNILISNNRFVGAFVTAINIAGADGDLSEPMRNADIEVSDNFIRRTIGYYDYVEDHGIYAWGGIRMNFLRNDIAGWALSSSGGCMKIRNADEILIDSNHCQNSGIMLYTYSSTNPIPVLSNLLAVNNTIDLTETFTPPAQQASFSDLPAIMYWRNYEPNNTSIEKNLEITQNSILRGSISIRSKVDPKEVKVHDNSFL